MRDSWTLKKPLREWQQHAASAWLNAGGHGIVRVVTGAGKTYLGLHLAMHVRLEHPPARILIVVPTLALMDQWHVSLVEDLGVSEDDIACYGGGYKADTPVSHNPIRSV